MKSMSDDGHARFVVRPRPYPGESHDGYFIRVAEANGYPNSCYITGITDRSSNSGRVCKGISSASIARRDRLERQLRLPKDELNRRWPMLIAIPPPEETVQIAGVALARADLRLGATQICPECVKEDGYCQQLWEVRYYTVCHRHQRLMLTHCPACESRLSVHRGKLLQCGHCGTDLGDGASKRRKIHKDNLLLAQLTAMVMSGRKPGPTGSASLDRLFEADLVSGFRALRMMAWLSNNKMKEWLALLHGEAVQRHQELMEVLVLFERWPAAWHLYLSSRATRASRPKKVALAALYPREMRAFNQQACSVPFMRNAFWDWLRKEHAVFGNSEEFYLHTGRRVDTASLTSISAACRELGISSCTIMQWAKKGTLQLEIEEVGALKRIFVTRESVARRLVTLKGQMDFKTTSIKLKISRDMVNEFIAAGLLTETVDQASGLQVILKSEVEKLFASIEYMRKKSKNEKDINMNAALVMTTPVWSGLAVIIRNIVNGRLNVTAFNRSRGIHSIRISKERLSQLMALDRFGSDDEWINLDLAASVLKMHRNAVRRRIGKGIRGKNLRPNKGVPLWFVRRADCLSVLNSVRS